MRDPGRGSGRSQRHGDRDRDRQRLRDKDREKDRERERDKAFEREQVNEIEKERVRVEQSGYFANNEIVKLQDDVPRSRRFPEEVITASWNAKGTKIACSKTDLSLRIWSMKSVGEPSSSLPVVVNKPHEKPIESLSWKPDSETVLATVGKDKYVKIWNSLTGNVVHEFAIEEDELLLVGYSPNSKYIACASWNNAIIIMDSTTGEILQKIELALSVHSMAWSNSSDFLFVGLGDGSITVIYREDEIFKQVYTLNGHRSSIKWIKQDSRGRYLYVASNEGVVSVWSLKTLAVLRTFGDVDQSVGMVDCSPDSRLLAITFDGDEPTRVYFTDSWKEAHVVTKSTVGAMTLPVFQFCPKNSGTFLYTTSKGEVAVSIKRRKRYD